MGPREPSCVGTGSGSSGGREANEEFTGGFLQGQKPAWRGGDQLEGVGSESARRWEGLGTLASESSGAGGRPN